MCRTQCVLALITLCLGLAHSYSDRWDFVVGTRKRFDFYDNYKIKYAERSSPPGFVEWLTYDPVHNRVLYYTNFKRYFLTSYDVETKITQMFIKDYPQTDINTYAYDPITELIFVSDQYSLYSFELTPGEDKKLNGTVVFNFERTEGSLREVALDICGKYIYWISIDFVIERIPYDGSKREVIIDSNNNLRIGLNIERQKIYWIEFTENNDHLYTVESADLNGNNQITLYSQTNEKHLMPVTLTLTKDFIYWANNDKDVWKLPKNLTHVTNETGILYSSEGIFRHMAAYYEIEEYNKATKECEALKSNISSINVSKDTSLLCVHGTKVSGNNSLCECTLGYTGERCDVSVCQNYCFQGQCIVNAEGQPKCRCNTNYSGTRCESTACYNYCLNNGYCLLNESNQPVCHCSAKFDGERCEVPIPQHSKQQNSIFDYRNNNLFDVSICQNYCVRGDCSVNAEGQPMCRCNAGYSGDRCESNACHNYCLNNGVCSLNETSKPVCQCSRGFKGERCDVQTVQDCEVPKSNIDCQNYCVQGQCSVNAEGQPKCRCNAGYSGDRCEDNVCYNYCLNNGVCSLNETSKPVCQCSRGFTGERCDVSDLLIKCIQTVSLLKDILKADLASITLGRELETTCA